MEKDNNYIIWQNRAFRFYLAARLLLLNEQYSAAAFCGLQSIETLMKATLLYWDRSFDAKSTGHKMKGMIRTIKNKVKGAKQFECPEYFFSEKRYQSITRYPSKGKGILVPASFLQDLDHVFRALIELVPFQFNSELIRALNGRTRKDLLILRRKNLEVRLLRKSLNTHLAKRT